MARSARTASSDAITHVDDRNYSTAGGRQMSVKDPKKKANDNVNAKLAKPLAFETPEELRRKGRAYAKKRFLGDKEDIRASSSVHALLRTRRNGKRSRVSDRKRLRSWNRRWPVVGSSRSLCIWSSCSVLPVRLSSE